MQRLKSLDRFTVVFAIAALIGTIWTEPAAAKNISKSRIERPILSGFFPAKIRFQVSSALRLASDQLSSHQPCRDLYLGFGVEGLEALLSATYRLAQTQTEVSLCSERSAAAFATVGGSSTHLCPKLFASLSVHKAAVILIHESLHHSGMTEWPHDREALRSTEINTLIRDRCGL